MISKGIFKTWLSSNDIQESLVSFQNDVTDNSRFKNQGFQKCFCKVSSKQCNSKKCAYFQNNNLYFSNIMDKFDM